MADTATKQTVASEPKQELQMAGLEGALATIGVSIDDIAKDARLGGQIGMQDIAIPYLYLLQSNSPQVNTDHDKYIEGAKPSMFYLTVIEKVWEGREKGILIVPCYYERLITEWIDRDEGGGLIRSYPAGDPIMNQAKPDEKNKMRLPNRHILVDTAYHYVMVQDPESRTWHQCIMPCKSTFLKKSRRLNSDISTTVIPGTKLIAPRFLYMYRVKTEKEQKDDNVWNVPNFVQESMVSADVYQNAKLFAKVAAESSLRRPQAESEHAATEGNGHARVGREVDDDGIPF
jgi:hypothetical protein